MSDGKTGRERKDDVALEAALRNSMVVPASRLAVGGHHAARWRLAELAGRLVEVSSRGAGSAMTVAVGLVVEAQREGEATAWVASDDRCFFPPDLDAAGVDLAALAVIRARGGPEAAHAAEVLVRSGGFGLVVVDLCEAEEVPAPLQSRLGRLVQLHDAVLLFLTGKAAESASMGPMISLRGHASRRRTGPGRHLCELRIDRDRRSAPGWLHSLGCRAPEGCE